MDKVTIKNCIFNAVMALNKLSFAGDQLEQAIAFKRGLEALHDAIAKDIEEASMQASEILKDVEGSEG